MGQCTGAGNWTKVRYYSAQELGTGQRPDITVYCTGPGNWTKVRSGQILQCTGPGNWTKVRYDNLRPKIYHISVNSKQNSKRL
jgi:hypothetical protein